MLIHDTVFCVYYYTCTRTQFEPSEILLNYKRFFIQMSSTKNQGNDLISLLCASLQPICQQYYYNLRQFYEFIAKGLISVVILI